MIHVLILKDTLLELTHDFQLLTEERDPTSIRTSLILRIYVLHVVI